ncbi:hypothetical protein EGN73_18695 [Arthrospiribacter ruber]|uniref:RHS repeat-associated core domain-containing protein n=1 Tax=Arthrospiribacter ruber TaxID=2487934 RepID=A0A951J0I1_9BACT|nr:hypothetical protein [Arthrospiribacter ruber]
MSVDPLTGSYPMLTPYQYASNTPIQAIDLDGLEAVRYPGVGTTTEMLQKPTDQEVKEVYRAYRRIALGVYDFFNAFRPQAAMGPGDPNYIPIYSEVKDAYRGISNTIENGSTEDRFRLGTVGALSVFGGVEAFSKFRMPNKVGIPSSVKTPYGEAVQSLAEEALSMRSYVESGGKLYRIGTTGKSHAAEAQFWATENPLSDPKAFSVKYGIPVENITNANFLEIGTLRPGNNFITRPAPNAPGGPQGGGGGIEVVTPASGVKLESFNTINK